MQLAPRISMRQLASSNYGILRGSDLEELGLDKGFRHRMCATGEIERLSQSVYRLVGVPISWEGELLTLCWAQSPHGWISHRSAAKLWGVPGFNDRALDVIVPRHSRRPRIESEFRLHESRKLPKADGTLHQGLPVTTPMRTIVDVAAVTSEERLEHLVESMQRLGHCTIEDIEDTARRLCGKGRHGTRKLRAVLARQNGSNRRVDSQTNIRLRHLLLKAGLPEPYMEFPVTASGNNYFADLAYPAQRILIECVSETYHLRRESYAKDNTRRNQLMTAGWLVLEFTWHQVYEQPRACVQEIRCALLSRRNLPKLP